MRRSRSQLRRLLVTLCALGALLAASATSAEAGSPFINSLWGPIKFPPGQAGCPGPARCSAFPLYKELGVEMFQYQIPWYEIAPTRPANPLNPNDPAYVWPSEFQFAVQQAAADGIKVAFLIKGTPPWANGGRASNYAPTNPADFANFAYAAARRFPSVHHWQIWGEPTRQNNFLPQGREGANLYARILDAAYASIKSANPQNTVIGGMSFFGGYTRPPLWIKYMRLPNGKPPHMDWYGHNPFEARFPNINAGPNKLFRGLSDVDTLWKEVKRHYQRRVRLKKRKVCRSKRFARRHPRRCFRRRWVYRRGHPTKLWLSEWSIQTDHGSFVFPYFVSRADQVRYLNAAFALARSLPYVSGMGWYHLIDYAPAPNSPTWGLMEYDGDPKPVFGAYRSLP